MGVGSKGELAAPTKALAKGEWWARSRERASKRLTLSFKRSRKRSAEARARLASDVGRHRVASYRQGYRGEPQSGERLGMEAKARLSCEAAVSCDQTANDQAMEGLVGYASEAGLRSVGAQHESIYAVPRKSMSPI